MSYTRSHNKSEYFIPLAAAALDADDLSSAAVHGEMACVRSNEVYRLMFVVTVVTVDPGIVEFNRRPTLNSASAEVALGTITIPGGTTPGSVLFTELSSPVLFAVGEGLAFEVTSTATSGNGLYNTLSNNCEEVAVNESNMTASA